ncbi:MAG: FadR/GntR family transcriptional regulator [Parvibaculaceae bacterium]
MAESSPGNSNYALEKLRDLLRANGFDSTGRLPTERALSEELGVGRRAVRRALEVLETEGLIWRRQGSGTYAGQPRHGLDQHVGILVDKTDFMEVMEVRLRIEPQLAQLAALRAKPADVRRMYDLIARIAESADADAHELWDGALHRLIAQCAGNRLFLAMFDVVNHVRQDQAWQKIRERARKAAGPSGSKALLNQQHARIADAIAAHDPGKAGEAMRQHLLTLQENLIRVTSIEEEDARRA